MLPSSLVVSLLVHQLKSSFNPSFGRNHQISITLRPRLNVTTLDDNGSTPVLTKSQSIAILFASSDQPEGVQPRHAQLLPWARVPTAISGGGRARPGSLSRVDNPSSCPGRFFLPRLQLPIVLKNPHCSQADGSRSLHGPLFNQCIHAGNGRAQDVAQASESARQPRLRHPESWAGATALPRGIMMPGSVAPPHAQTQPPPPGNILVLRERTRPTRASRNTRPRGRQLSVCPEACMCAPSFGQLQPKVPTANGLHAHTAANCVHELMYLGAPPPHVDTVHMLPGVGLLEAQEEQRDRGACTTRRGQRAEFGRHAPCSWKWRAARGRPSERRWSGAGEDVCNRQYSELRGRLDPLRGLSDSVRVLSVLSW